ncbi:hypothetical protein EYC80_000065 [Monilinia laxa]|uniref:Vacuolar-sorting protein SNF8 n=1 Tax=Monilinia laxa TaxID=61186 RepID=A0A5N6K9H7_MONLA|nr:hypothetical protein EYC80_000065 [Monilinia laxa]
MSRKGLLSYIRSNPTFRAEFARMCSAIGVDPLASSNNAGGKDGSGSFWAQMLGTSVNDFYFELAVRVVEVCGATREENGGLIGVKEVKDRIMSTRMEGGAEITDDDILRAVTTLKPLGSSYSTITVGHKTYIRSIPKELNTDQSAVLEAAQLLGYVSVSMLMLNLRWPRARAKTAIEDLVSEKPTSKQGKHLFLEQYQARLEVHLLWENDHGKSGCSHENLVLLVPALELLDILYSAVLL